MCTYRRGSLSGGAGYVGQACSVRDDVLLFSLTVRRAQLRCVIFFHKSKGGNNEGIPHRVRGGQGHCWLGAFLI